MSGQDPATPKDWEIEINALLDGELDEAAASALAAAAAEDRVLALAIVEAWQVHKNLDQLRPETAPASLRRKLRRIPREQKAATGRLVFAMPRWLPAGGLAAMVLVAVAMLLNEPAGRTVISSQATASRSASDAARREQTRRELAIAFFYLDKAGLRLGQEIREVLNDELSAPVKDELSKHMPYVGPAHKENNV
jgi:anti-sigma factor RsiW